MLKNLDKDVKVELITMLASSLAKPDNSDKTHNKNWASKIYGSWSDDERSAEEIVAEIRNSRHFHNRDNIDML